MIRAQIQKNGYLKITADNEGRADLAYCYSDRPGRYGNGFYQAQDEVAEGIRRDNFEFVLPEWIAALTDAPIITNDLTIEDDGSISFVGDVWWFPGYMLADPWQELKNTGKVIFEPEENNKSLPKSKAA